MKRFISHVEDSAWGAFPGIAGVTASGPARSRAVVAGQERPLWLWMHELEAGCSIRVDRPPVGHVLYVWDGSITVGEEPLDREGALIVEHGAQTQLRAGTDGARLLHFQRPESHPERPARAGGHVHAVQRTAAFSVERPQAQRSATVWADAGCPTCELWLHASSMRAAKPIGGFHYHTEDEIIVVVQGTMLFGRDAHGPGTALAIDANAPYGFGVGEGGLTFINFRANDPSIVDVVRGAQPHVSAPLKERDIVRGLVTRP